MKTFWVNVYADDGLSWAGNPWDTRGEAAAYTDTTAGAAKLNSRVKVTLK